jgi:hypothetical protein
MIKRFAFSFMLFAVAALAADPTLVGLVMPDAKILTGIQVDRSQASPFGQYVLAKTQFNDPGFLKFVADTGFDPRNDLREIVAATGGTEQNSIVLGRGAFQAAKIVAAAQAGGGSVTKYKGVDIILTDKSGNSAIAFLDGSIGLFGNLAAVQATIDRRASGAVFNGALAQKAQSVSATNHAWFVTLTPLSEFLAGKTGESQVNTMMQSNLLQAVQSASGGLTYPLAAGQEDRLPPEPRLQTNPRADLKDLRDSEERVLESYSWVDRNGGVVRIPIDEAMKLTLQRGLPARTEQKR